MRKGLPAVSCLFENLGSYCFNVRQLDAPIFSISHEKFGKHLLFGTMSSMAGSDMQTFWRMHPLKQVALDFGAMNFLTLSSELIGVERSIFRTLKKVLKQEKNIDLKSRSLHVTNQEFMTLRNSFVRQCQKLPKKIIYGKGVLKKLPFCSTAFAIRLEKYLKHHHRVILAAYLCGDLKAYLLCLACFWGICRHFKPKNQCHDLSNVLNTHITKKVESGLESLNKECPSILMVNINLMFKPKGLLNMLKKNGWKVEMLDRKIVQSHRAKYRAKEFLKKNISARKRYALQHEVLKLTKHAKKLLWWAAE